MTTTIYLDLETLVIEEKESTRDYMELLDSAHQCKDSVDGYTGRKYKKFASREAAIQFMIDNGAPLVSYDYLR